MTSTRPAPMREPDIVRSLWDRRGRSIGAAFDVTPCPYTVDDIARLQAQGRRVGFLPQELATGAARHQLGAIFPEMRDFTLLAPNVCVNDENRWGWFDYDATVDAPYGNLDEVRLLEQLAEDGRSLLSLNQYIVASQDNRHFTGRYLDEGDTWSRIGSRITGRLVAARFDGETSTGRPGERPVPGRLVVAYDVARGDHGTVLGARTCAGGPRPDRVVSPDDDDAEDVTTRTAARLFRPITDLEAEWDRIASVCVERGYHTELGMTADRYLASLPRLDDQPTHLRGRFDTPLLVETRIAWKRLAQLAGMWISSFSTSATYQPLSPDSAPRSEPYVGWFNWWGQRFDHPIAPMDAHRELSADEVGANLHELIAMEVAHPELNANGLYFEAIGYTAAPQAMDDMESPSTFSRTPCTWRPRDVPEIACNLNPTAYEMFRPLARAAVTA